MALWHALNPKPSTLDPKNIDSMAPTCGNGSAIDGVGGGNVTGPVVGGAAASRCSLVCRVLVEKQWRTGGRKKLDKSMLLPFGTATKASRIKKLCRRAQILTPLVRILFLFLGPNFELERFRVSPNPESPNPKSCSLTQSGLPGPVGLRKLDLIAIS